MQMSVWGIGSRGPCGRFTHPEIDQTRLRFNKDLTKRLAKDLTKIRASRPLKLDYFVSGPQPAFVVHCTQLIRMTTVQTRLGYEGRADLSRSSSEQQVYK